MTNDNDLYVPGVYECAKCSFVLISSNFNAHTGQVSANMECKERCPNCDVPMWRVSWKKRAEEIMATAETQMERAVAAEARVAELEHVILRAAHVINFYQPDSPILEEMRTALNDPEAGKPAPPPKHRYQPNKKYPWFCAQCGYPPQDDQHIQEG